MLIAALDTYVELAEPHEVQSACTPGFVRIARLAPRPGDNMDYEVSEVGSSADMPCFMTGCHIGSLLEAKGSEGRIVSWNWAPVIGDETKKRKRVEPEEGDGDDEDEDRVYAGTGLKGMRLACWKPNACMRSYVNAYITLQYIQYIV